MNDKIQAIQKAIKSLEKEFGRNVVIQLGESKKTDIEVIPTGSVMLDNATGIGGWPRGRIVEIYGKESGGKTLLSLLSIAEVQRMGGTAAFIDAEHSFVVSWAEKLGVNTKDLYLCQENCAEEALEIMDRLIRSYGFDLVVLDSIASLVPKEELEGTMSDQQMGLQARIMGKALRKLTHSIHDSNTACIFINQVRTKMGVMFGEKEDTPGGRALKFYASMRVQVSKVSGSTISEDGKKVGHQVHCLIKKNKVGPPFGEAIFTVNYFTGIDKIMELIDLAILKNIVKIVENEKYEFNGKIYSKNRLYSTIKKNEDIYKTIKEAINGTEKV